MKLKINTMRSKFKGPFVNRKLLQAVDKINAELEKLLDKSQGATGLAQETTNPRSLKIPTKICL